MKIGVPRETYPGERRVALVPAVIPGLLKAGFEVVVEAGAGTEAAFPDADYVAKGAKILPTRAEVFHAADIIVQVLCHGSNDTTGKDDLPLLRPEHVLIGFLAAAGIDRDHSRGRGQGRHVVCRRAHAADDPAQSMDALTSMATIAGYKAVVIGADKLPRIFPMLTTAAGTITPARVLVIGAGVAGLQAIATARRLGAVASAYDLRPASKEQVAEPGGPVRGASRRGQRRPGRPRLRPRAGRYVLRAPARVAGEGRRGKRRRRSRPR